jgi:hypothetical protein
MVKEADVKEKQDGTENRRLEDPEQVIHGGISPDSAIKPEKVEAQNPDNDECRQGGNEDFKIDLRYGKIETQYKPKPIGEGHRHSIASQNDYSFRVLD